MTNPPASSQQDHGTTTLINFWSCRQIGIPVLVLVLVLMFCSACKPRYGQKKLSFSTSQLVATVNSEPISLGDYEKKYESSSLHWESLLPNNKQKKIELRNLILKNLIDEKILNQEASRTGLYITDAELDQKLNKLLGDKYKLKSPNFISLETKQGWRENIRQRLLHEKLVHKEVLDKIPIAEKEMRLYYQRNLHEFRQPEVRQVSHIAVGTKKIYGNVLRKFRSGVDFAKLAHEYSTTPDRNLGGDLGLVEKGILPVEFDGVVFALDKIGDINPAGKPVQTQMGFHLFRLEQKRPARLFTYAEARPQIRAILLSAQQPQAYKKWIAKLHKKASIQINENVLQNLL